jgi:aspartate carbamoyltransferase regulatory subunit
MKIESEKSKIIDWIKSLENETVIDHLKTLQKVSNQNQIYRLSQAEKQAVEIGLKSLSEEQTYTTEEVNDITRAKYPQLFKEK